MPPSQFVIKYVTMYALQHNQISEGKQKNCMEAIHCKENANVANWLAFDAKKWTQTTETKSLLIAEECFIGEL